MSSHRLALHRSQVKKVDVDQLVRPSMLLSVYSIDVSPIRFDIIACWLSCDVIGGGRVEVRQDGEFRSFLKENAKLSVYEVSNDGNSLFKAVTHQLYGPGKDFMQVRKACCDWMVQ